MKFLFLIAIAFSSTAWADAQVSDAQVGGITVRTIRAVAKNDFALSPWPGFIEVTVSSGMLTRRTMYISLKNIQEVEITEDGVSVNLAIPSTKGSLLSITTLVVPRSVMDKEAALDMFKQASSGS